MRTISNKELIAATTALVFIILFLAVLAPPASAGLACDSRYQGNTILSLGCELGSTNNDSEAQVNLDLMFGYDNWDYIVREFDDGGVVNPIVDHSASYFGGEWVSGSFTIDWDTTTFARIMFVQKDGAGDPDTYVGWNLDPNTGGVQHYAYNTPFINPNGGNLKEISHVTWYGQGGGGTRCDDCNNVPAPGTLFLMGAGLFIARRWIPRAS